MSFGAFGFGAVTFGETSDGGGAQIFATLPALSADATAVAPGTATATAILPALMAAITAEAPVAAAVSAILPMFTAALTGDTPASAFLAATLPSLAASFAISTESRRNTRSWQPCPRPASGFTPKGRQGTLRDGSVA